MRPASLRRAPQARPSKSDLVTKRIFSLRCVLQKPKTPKGHFFEEKLYEPKNCTFNKFLSDFMAVTHKSVSFNV
jgi:hypothetical protein